MTECMNFSIIVCPQAWESKVRVEGVVRGTWQSSP